MIKEHSASLAYPSRRTLGIVTALSLEGAVLPQGSRWQAVVSNASFAVRRASLNGLDLLCVRSGPGVSAAREAAELLVGHGVQALLCLGVSGGLAPGLKAADLVLAEAVALDGFGRDGGESLASIPLSCAWVRQALPAILASALTHTPQRKVRLGRIVSLERPVLSPAHKADLWRRSMALAADLESAGVADAAARAGLPMLVLRAVCDSSERDLSPELPRLLDEQGRVRPGRLFCSLASRPALLADLLASQREFSAALGSLRRAVDAMARAGALLPEERG
ncbi:purine or other phosphorylase family 1 [Desulfocurvibacter africanus]|uniref:Purine or other phosphorylase family 1 n=1 Tax=Desulfocurvibacter africanus subsp. africanus str. Walvis Bay TaxID=690850 RepID=F3YVF6_DESAF|nr:purine or other phosphorylase family 1 [Desulfocurvibacter africanus]EGJ48548.1 purine or other phosphorylase family 1 [Desulfocurvibacter africanus subsp. africanus str. Walvis Bay]